MNRLILFLCVIFALLLIIGCEEEPTSAIDPPEALVLEGGSNGHDLMLNWSASTTTDIEGYRVYYDGTQIWEGTETEYTHPNAELGEYEIVGYRDEEESDPITHDTHDNIETGSGMIYAFYVSGEPSGYGWNLSTGSGSSYSFSTENAAYIDFYYDNADDLTSADVYSGDFPNGTWFSVSSTAYNSLALAPTTSEASYYNYVTPTLNETYAVNIEKDGSYDTYAKMQITAMDDTENSISFNWTLQTIDNWRVLGD